VSRDDGTVVPLVLLSFLLAGLLVTAGTAASAAFLAQRDLAGVCDGAALAGAAAVDRAALDRADVGRAPADVGRAAADRAPADRAPADRAAADRTAADRSARRGAALPLDPAAVGAAVERYRERAARPDLVLTAGTDGRTVTVECRRTVRIPFGAVLGRGGGLPRTAVARARSVLLPPG
jgi:hypothetical protein